MYLLEATVNGCIRYLFIFFYNLFFLIHGEAVFIYRNRPYC